MKTQTATASRVIHAPADQVYKIIADYRNTHLLILPKGYFLSLDVEEGGYGAGTIVNFTMRALGRTQSFRSLITEPEPGRLLVETDIRSETPTSFHVIPAGDPSTTRVTITTTSTAEDHARRRCSDASARSLDDRIALWTERLARSGGTWDLTQIYRHLSLREARTHSKFSYAYIIPALPEKDAGVAHMANDMSSDWLNTFREESVRLGHNLISYDGDGIECAAQSHQLVHMFM